MMRRPKQLMSRELKRQINAAESALDGLRKTTTLEDPQTLGAMTTLAMLYGKNRELAKAIALQQEVRDRTARLLGSDSYETIAATHRLGYLLRHAGDLDLAKKHQLDVLSWRRQRAGDDSEKYINSMVNLAVTLKARKEFTELAPLQKEILQTYERSYGPTDKRTMRAIEDLVQTERNLESSDSAEILEREYFDRSKAIFTNAFRRLRTR
jgi:Tetratricopeptide repeat